MWTSAANRGYTVVTLHRIDPGWHFTICHLGFKRVEYPHSGPRLADHLLEVVTSMDSALLRSMWAITTDNASQQ
ncbi:Ribonuclease H-like domain [Phytophthora cactorum]|nr:Ribonuclease H-like domain [Phytophthora cactorum]